jgi:hypothetical protein
MREAFWITALAIVCSTAVALAVVAQPPQIPTSPFSVNKTPKGKGSKK